jgi:opacity protein-like surface antigen
MKVQFGCIVLGVAIATGALPAKAADWGAPRESYKDMGAPAAVPVPAPIPVAEYRSAWYFRFDAGLGVISDPDISGSVDDLYGAPGGPIGPDPLAMPAWFDSDFDTFLTLGGGVGYYFGNGWRVDGTIEKRSKDDVTIDGFTTWDGIHGDINPVVYGEIDPDGGSRLDWSESTKLDGTLWMANLYYDFAARGSFTPYIGVGLGFVWNEISRNAVAVGRTCADAVACAADDYTVSGATSASDKADKVSLAAAAMVGFSYDVNDIVAVDMGYRYLFMQGASATLNMGDAVSRVEIGDQHVHQLRAGLRFNVN